MLSGLFSVSAGRLGLPFAAIESDILGLAQTGEEKPQSSARSISFVILRLFVAHSFRPSSSMFSSLVPSEVEKTVARLSPVHHVRTISQSSYAALVIC
jgi:hypothetical protein